MVKYCPRWQDIWTLYSIPDRIVGNWEPTRRWAFNEYVWSKPKHWCGCTCSQLIQQSSYLTSISLIPRLATTPKVWILAHADPWAISSTCLEEYWIVWSKDMSCTFFMPFLWYGQCCASPWDAPWPYSAYLHRSDCRVPCGRGCGAGGHGEESQIQLPATVDVLLKSGWMSGVYFMELETITPVIDYGHPKFITKDYKQQFWQRSRVVTGNLSRKVMESPKQISFSSLLYLCSNRESLMRADSEWDTWYSLKLLSHLPCINCMLCAHSWCARARHPKSKT